MKNKCPQWLREAARKGGSVKSAKKAASSAENGKLGGRPRTRPTVEEYKALCNLAEFCKFLHGKLPSLDSELAVHKDDLDEILTELESARAGNAATEEVK